MVAMNVISRSVLSIFLISFFFSASTCDTTGTLIQSSQKDNEVHNSDEFQLKNDEEKVFNKEVDRVSQHPKVKLTVFYEALCPDSIAFFNKQLRPKYPELSEYVKLDLIPYGNAKQTKKHGHWHFTCQHGPKECEYNKIHACAIKVLKKDSKYFNLVACLMRNTYESSHLDKCAAEAKVNLAAIKKCSKSSVADNLLATLGLRTHHFKPQIKWVPSVAFNGKYSKKDQEDSMKDLSKVICRHLNPKPKVCHHHQ